MSYKAQDAAWVELSKIAFTDRDVPQNAKLLLMRLAWHLNERSGLCCPCIATHSDALGVDEKTVKRSIKALEDVDLLIVERRNGAHNHYALPFLKIKGLARQ